MKIIIYKKSFQEMEKNLTGVSKEADEETNERQINYNLNHSATFQLKL